MVKSTLGPHSYTSITHPSFTTLPLLEFLPSLQLPKVSIISTFFLSFPIKFYSLLLLFSIPYLLNSYPNFKTILAFISWKPSLNFSGWTLAHFSVPKAPEVYSYSNTFYLTWNFAVSSLSSLKSGIQSFILLSPLTVWYY